MADAVTRTVSGKVSNLSLEQIADAVLRFDVDPPYVTVGDNIIVGQQNANVVGEPITPVAPDGSWSVDIVAVPHQEWTITVTVDGPNIEDPKPKFVIVPPMDDSTDPIGVGVLVVPQSTGGVVLPKLATLTDVQFTGLTDGDGPLWDSTIGKFVNGKAAGSGGGGSLPSGGKAGDALVKTSETDGAATWRTLGVGDITGAMPLANVEDSGALAVVTSSGAVIGSGLAAADVASSLTDLAANKAPVTGVLTYARASDGSWPAHPAGVLVQWIETDAAAPKVPDGMVNGDIYTGPTAMAGLPAGGTP